MLRMRNSDRVRTGAQVFLYGVIAGLSGLLLYTLGSVWAARNGYPYDLEWMEGGMLTHAWRLLQGKPTHGEPSVDWIPYLYPTGYASFLAFLARFTDLSMALGRSVSLAGTLMASLAMPYITRRLGRGVLPGAVAAVVYLGCYPYSGAFYDLVRLDGLMMGLWAWSIALVIDDRKGRLEAAALLLAAAYLVKHNVALTGFPIVVGLWHRSGRGAALRFALWSAIPALAVTLYLNAVNDGHYLTWLIEVPSSHSWAGERIFPGIGKDHGRALPFACIMATGALFVVMRQPKWMLRFLAVSLAGAVITSLVVNEVTSLAFLQLICGLTMVFTGLLAGLAVLTRRLPSPSWRVTLGVGVAGTALLMCMLMRGHVGGYINVNMPAHWVIALASGIALGCPVADMRGWRVGSRYVAATALAASQLAWAASSLEPKKLTPLASDIAVGDALVEELRGVEGPVLSPFNPWLLVLAGHEEPGWHLIALWDVNHERGPWPDSGKMIDDAMAEQHWTHILAGTRDLGHGIDDYYRGAPLLVRRGELRPKTGFQVRPLRLRKRKTLQQPAP